MLVCPRHVCPRLHVTRLIAHTPLSAQSGELRAWRLAETWSLNTPRVSSSSALAALASLRRITSFREVTRTSPFSTDRRSYQPPTQQVLTSTRVSERKKNPRIQRTKAALYTKSYARRTPTYFTRGSLMAPSKNGKTPTSGVIATESNNDNNNALFLCVRTCL